MACGPTNLNEQNNDDSEHLNTMAAFNELTTMPTEVDLLLNEPELSHEPQSEDTGNGISKANTMIVDYSETSGHEIGGEHAELQHEVVEDLSLESCLMYSSIKDSVPEAAQTAEVISISLEILFAGLIKTFEWITIFGLIPPEFGLLFLINFKLY